MDVIWHLDINPDWYIEKKLVHEIHTSERRSFRACRRRWDWLFNKALYPYVTAKPLEFGVAYHEAMEAYYDPHWWSARRDVMIEYAIKVFVNKCEEQRKAFLAQSAVPYLDENVKEDYDERVALGKGMLRYYFTEIASVQDANLTPVKVEIGFMVPISNPETGEEVIWCKCVNCFEKYLGAALFADMDGAPVRTADQANRYNEDIYNNWKGLPVVYSGRCDMLAVDNEGYYWVVDWKTTTTVHIDNDEFLDLDDQVISYVWALRKLGVPVQGFIYHEQKKAFPEPPKQNKTRRLGCLFSVAKNQNTDYDTYLKTIVEQDNDAYQAGHYDTFLDFLKEEGIVYFKRWQLHKSEYECEQAEINIGYEALDMIDPNLRIYPSPGRFGCSFCAFRQPCLSKNDGGDYLYSLDTMFEKREHYYVRKEASTESKGGE